MTAQYVHTGAFREARFIDADLRECRFTDADLSGARFRDCDLRQVRIVSSWLTDVTVAVRIGNLVVNDVDVTAYVGAELDRRYPERIQIRTADTADGYRAAWDTVERLWAGTMRRAERLPERAV